MKQPNAANIEAMTNQEAQEAAETLAIQLCGSDRFKTDLALKLGASRPAVNSWFADGARPPTLVIMYLSAELERKALADTMKGLGQIMSVIDNYR